MRSRTRLIFAVVTSAAAGLAVAAPVSAAAVARPPTVFGNPDVIRPADPSSTYTRFGNVIDMDGDTMVVGAYQDNDPEVGDLVGAAYVYVRDGDEWVQQAKLRPSDPQAFDRFGGSVAIHGDTLAVASDSDADGIDLSGSVYLFERTGSTWTERQKLYPQDPQSNEFFGSSIDLSDDTLVVGADGRDIAGVCCVGALDVFVRTGGTWVYQQEVIAPGAPDLDAGFGSPVELDGDRMIVGAPSMQTARGKFAGAAFVFERTGTSWAVTAKLTSARAKFDSNFGSSVALDGDTVLIGEGNPFEGPSHVYVFTRSGQRWAVQASIAGPTDRDGFGRSLDVQGDTAVVGDSSASDPLYQQGAAHLYTRAAGAWTERAVLVNRQPAESDQFGSEVVLTEDYLAVGVPDLLFNYDPRVFVYNR